MKTTIVSKKGRLIVLEGFDYSGKTTVCKMLSNSLNLDYHKSPEGVFSDARSIFDQPNIQLIDRLAFYTSVSIRNSLVITQKLNVGINVVLDRHYYSVLAYHFKEYKAAEHDLRVIYDSLIQPDYLFYLDVKFENIINRKKLSKNEYENDDELFFSERKYNLVSTSYKKILPKYTTFIANDASIDLCLNYILNIVKDDPSIN
jgi:thymidylate kinase